MKKKGLETKKMEARFNAEMGKNAGLPNVRLTTNAGLKNVTLGINAFMNTKEAI